MAAVEADVMADLVAGEAEPAEPEYRYTDEELAALIDQEISSSATGDSDDQEDDLALAVDYYRGVEPQPAGTNTSDYVSMEVFESVESMKAKLMKTFAGSRDVIRFRPMSERDVEPARLRTKYVKRILFSENPGTAILHDVFHDLCLKRFACVKRYIKTDRKVTWGDVERVPEEEIEAAVITGSIEDIQPIAEEWEDVEVQTPLGPALTRRKLITARVKMVEERQRICIEVLKPENVHVFAGVEDLSDPERIPGVAITYRKRRHELIAEGFDPAIVEELESAAGAALTDDRTVMARNRRSTNGSTIKGLDEIDIEEAFLRVDMTTPRDQPETDAELWQVIKSGAAILLKQRVDEIPLRFATAYRIAHEPVGLSVADVAMDVQRAASNVTRGVIDNVHRVNAGVRAADLSKIRNPRDLIDNPIGGIVDTADPQAAFAVVPQPAISAATMPMMEVLATQKEMRTGDMRMGRGLNTGDIITHQNAKDMIAQLIEVGSARPMMLAKLIAEMFMRPLLLDLWKLGFEYDVPVKLDVDGNVTDVNPKQLGEGDEMEVDDALTPEYGQKRAQNTIMLHSMVMANQTLAPLYQMEEQYAAMSEVFDLLGQPNWLGNPNDPKVVQRLQLAQQAAQQMQQQQQAQMAQRIGIEVAKLMAEAQAKQAEPKLKKEALDLQAATSAAKQNLEERKFQHDAQVDKAELQIEREQSRAASIGDV
jgi:hypothetical protein